MLLCLGIDESQPRSVEGIHGFLSMNVGVVSPGAPEQLPPQGGAGLWTGVKLSSGRLCAALEGQLRAKQGPFDEGRPVISLECRQP